MRLSRLLCVLPVLTALHCGGGDDDDDVAGDPTGDGGARPDASTVRSDASVPSGDAAVDAGPAAPPSVQLPRLGLGASELGVLVNDSDPQSVAVAAYYVQARQIPAANVVHLAFDPPGDTLSPEAFAPLYAQVQAALAATVQGLAVTWTQPYRVGAESITTAFAAGYDVAFTNTVGGCAGTKAVDTYDSDSVAPFTDHGIRPTMMLAAVDVDHAKQLIDRGVAADGKFPSGNAWLVRTTDAARSVRYYTYPQIVTDWTGSTLVHPTFVDASDGGVSNVIENQPDVLFYFTGLVSVDQLDTNTYVPGAVADHLTSYGGQVPQSGQMSIVRWLEGGVTASSGTAVEPCNFTSKFSDAGIVMRRYVRGEPLVQAYWKSIAWPGESVMVGEPLASPWGSRSSFANGTLTIESTALVPGASYVLRAKTSGADPGTVVQTVTVPAAPIVQLTTLTQPNATAPFYALEAASDAGAP